MLCNTLLQPAISVWSGLELQFVVFSLVCFRPFACCGRMPFFFFNMLSGRESSRHFVLNKKQLNIVSLYNVLGVHYHLGTLFSLHFLCQIIFVSPHLMLLNILYFLLAKIRVKITFTSTSEEVYFCLSLIISAVWALLFMEICGCHWSTYSHEYKENQRIQNISQCGVTV